MKQEEIEEAIARGVRRGINNAFSLGPISPTARTAIKIANWGLGIAAVGVWIAVAIVLYQMVSSLPHF